MQKWRNAEIEQCNLDIHVLMVRIEEFDQDVEQWKKDRAAATVLREKEQVDFKATVTDYAESLEALL